MCVCGGGDKWGGEDREEGLGHYSHHIKIYLSKRIDLDLEYRTLKLLEEKNRKIFS